MPTTRREARERAVELLYEADTKSLHPQAVTDALPIRPDAYALELAYGVADHVHDIDHVLGRYSQDWPVKRMAAMDRTVLRLGVYELALVADVPTGVCLSEAVELASAYGSTDETSRWANGILAAVADELRGPDGAARPWPRPAVVVFDMDGVFRHWTQDGVHAYEADLGLPHGTVVDTALGGELMHRAMVGELDVDAWAAEIAATVAEQHPGVSVDTASLAQVWKAADWRLDEAATELLADIHRAGQRTALFSNASTKLESDLAEIGIDEHLDHVANSSRLGLAKPDVAAFERVAADLAVDPASLFFVDDREVNVLGALDAGWHAVLMQGVDRLRATLARLGVPGAAQSA